MTMTVAQSKGVWVNNQWQTGSAGTFSIVIGVSEYSVLDGTEKSFGMSKLFVSAKTAADFFRWLRSDYRVTGVPLAKCWLLLAPTAAETPSLADLSGHFLEPTFDNCKKAIREWYAEMKQLPEAVATTSRSMFFFSGHGLEVLEDRQILLPADYDPTLPDEAISTENVARGLKSTKLPLHFLFLDACRNDHGNLGQYEPLKGSPILSAPASKAMNPDCFVPILYGSASGNQAFQPRTPAEGDSLFGEGLLAGLKADGLDPDCSKGTCCIYLHLLRPFVNQHVADLIRNRYKETVVQRVRVRGDQTEEVVTEVPKPGRTAPRAQPGAAAPGATTTLESLGMLTVTAQRPNLQPAVARFDEGHDFFGTEILTNIFRQLKLYDLTGRTWQDPNAVSLLNLRRDEASSVFAFDLHINGGQLKWLQFEDSATQRAYGCILPQDRSGITPFSVEVEVAYPTGEVPPTGQSLEIVRFEVALASQYTGFHLHQAAEMWKVYEMTGVRAVEQQFVEILPQDANALEKLVLEKRISPLSAAVGGLILVRGQRWDHLHDWLRNLANLAPRFQMQRSSGSSSVCGPAESPMCSLRRWTTFCGLMVKCCPHLGKPLAMRCVRRSRSPRTSRSTMRRRVPWNAFASGSRRRWPYFVPVVYLPLSLPLRIALTQNL